jgi:sugar diacid utilization regulator
MIFPISENEERLSLHCESMLADYFCKAREFTDRSSVYLTSQQIFKQLLSGEPLSQVVINRFCKEITAEPYFLLLTLQSHGIYNRTVHQLLVNEIKALGLECMTCEYQNTVAILISKNMENELLLLLQKKEWIVNLSVGISMPVYELRKLQIAYEQACFAMTEKEDPGIRRCSEYALSFYIRLLQQNEQSAHLRHPAIAALQRYDTSNHTDLLHTLDTYLQHNCSQNISAEALHIHLNSLKYRLRRIEELAEIDFKNSEELLYLRLSLEL